MMTRRTLFAGALLLLLLAGYVTQRLLFTDDASHPATSGAGAIPLPAFSFNDLDGASRSSDEWKGKILVINFWATWCPPCREEMPLFTEIQEKYDAQGVQFIGIAIDDPELVQDFSSVYAINFPILTGGMEAIKLANDLGNRFDSLPFTAIFDRQGNGRYIQAGEIDRKTLERELQSLL